jgi:hypothetical protein
MQTRVSGIEQATVVFEHEGREDREDREGGRKGREGGRFGREARVQGRAVV